MADVAPGGGVEQVLVAERPRLLGLAYRITGSRLDAEDIVQEAWERARRVGDDVIDRPAAWLTTVVARLALDHLKSAQRRRETYVGPWLPEPVVTGRRAPGAERGAGVGAAGAGGAIAAAGGGEPDPAELTELAESLTFGFLRVLEALSPIERVVFVMADVFAVPFPEIAGAVGRSPDACRQIATRARARVRDQDRRHQAPDNAARVADDLVGALVEGDADRVMALLAPDVVLVSDGGAAAHAARRPVTGAHRVSRFMLNLAKRGADLGPGVMRVEPVELNGDPAVIVLVGDAVFMTVAMSVDDGRVTGVHNVVNPDKLAALRLDAPLV